MKRDINDFITLVRSKNGRVKIDHNGQNQANIYLLMHELGFRKSILENKRIYYRREGEELIPSSFRNIVDAFFEQLRETEFINIPDDIRFADIVNHFYEKSPIKENALFTHFFSDTLTETEALQYKLLTDHHFKHKIEVQHLLSKLEEWKFEKQLIFQVLLPIMHHFISKSLMEINTWFSHTTIQNPILMMALIAGLHPSLKQGTLVIKSR